MADEVIAKLAAVLEIDIAELCKLAGRDIGGASFEAQVLGELQLLRRELRAGFKRLEGEIRDLKKRRERST